MAPHDPRVVLMGVSGSGKTTVGLALARRLELPFVDADDLHSDGNREKMASGRPLDDSDRWPWLDAVGRELAARPVIVACSALKRSYRDRLRSAAQTVSFVHLELDPVVLGARLADRRHEYMPATLLGSQLALLEPLDDDERGLTVAADEPLDDLVDAIATRLARGEVAA